MSFFELCCILLMTLIFPSCYDYDYFSYVVILHLLFISSMWAYSVNAIPLLELIWHHMDMACTVLLIWDIYTCEMVELKYAWNIQVVMRRNHQRYFSTVFIRPMSCIYFSCNLFKNIRKPMELNKSHCFTKILFVRMISCKGLWQKSIAAKCGSYHMSTIV